MRSVKGKPHGAHLVPHSAGAPLDEVAMTAMTQKATCQVHSASLRQFMSLDSLGGQPGHTCHTLCLRPTCRARDLHRIAWHLRATCAGTSAMVVIVAASPVGSFGEAPSGHPKSLSSWSL